MGLDSRMAPDTRMAPTPRMVPAVAPQALSDRLFPIDSDVETDFSLPPSSGNKHADKEALTNMLVGWYMAGYHTGYYRGLSTMPKELTEEEKKIKQEKEY